MARDSRVHSAQPALETKLASMTSYGDAKLAIRGGAIECCQCAVTVAASSAINTTETIVTPTFLVKANTMQPGTVYRVKISGTCTSTNADVNTFTLRYGTAGTISDSAIATVAPTAATGSAIPFQVEFTFVCRTATTAAAFGLLRNSGVTGCSNAAVLPGDTGTDTISTVLDRYLSVSYLSAATTTTVTVQLATIEVVCA